MIQTKTELKRLLALELCLAVGGIIVMSCLYIYSIGQQQRITENIFSHPFAVSNEAQEFRADVLELRKFMLEAVLTPEQEKATHYTTISRFEEQMDQHLTTVRKEFLGDQERVSNIMLEMDAWKKVRESIKSELLAGNRAETLKVGLQQASPHVEQILVDTDYVISFARSRALRFVEQGRAQQSQSKLLLALLAFLSLGTYILLSIKVRRRIYKLYEFEAQHATFDYLTGAYNHRSFISLGETEIKRARRHDHTLSLLIMDLDNFKHVNDTHGHDAGDAVLRQFTAVCRQNLRAEDFLCRIGGEEFAILLPDTDRQGAYNIAERIRQDVAGSHFKMAEDTFHKVTVSIGVATLDDEMATIGNLFKRADEAMYRSKDAGRNQVTAYCLI